MRRRTRIALALLLTLALLGAAFAWRIHHWGRPAATAYRRVEMAPGNPGGGPAWTYLRVADGRRLVATDSDGDGTVDTVLEEGEGAELHSFNRPSADDPEARWLVVCLDGIPYEIMLSLWEEGYFREFFRPVALIAPFPSESEVALTESLHAGPVPGYEHGYFDRQANRLRGGILQTLQEVDIPYLRLLDYDMGGIFKGLAYLLPRKSYHADMVRFLERFRASNKKLYLAHLATPDSLYHILPREEMRRLVIEADKILRELYYQAGGKLRITVYGDHGNSLALSRRVPLEQHLAERGFHVTSRLGEPTDVVIPAYGLIAFSAVYADPAQHAKLASALAEAEGVDLVIYRKPSGVVIESARGRAHMNWKKDGAAFRYEAVTGDPLRLLPVLDGLKQAGKMDAGGWVGDEDLLLATLDHDYPDPGRRLWQAAVNHVTNSADLFISYAPGYYYGSKLFSRFVTLLSTHGGFDRRQTLGFAMSTDAPRTRTIRSTELLPSNLVELKAALGKVAAAGNTN